MLDGVGAFGGSRDERDTTLESPDAVSSPADTARVLLRGTGLTLRMDRGGEYVAGGGGDIDEDLRTAILPSCRSCDACPSLVRCSTSE